MITTTTVRKGTLPNSLRVVFLLILLAVGCSRSPEQRAASLMNSGDKYLRNRDFMAALIQFRSAAQALPGSPEPEYRIGLTYLSMLDAQSALDHLLKAGKLDPKHLPTQIKLAELLSLNENLELVREAESRAQIALASAPENSDLLHALAMSEWRLGKQEDAVQHLQSILARFPGHLKSAVSLATARIVKNDFAGAEQVLQKAAEAKPANAESLVALAGYYRLMKNPVEAERQLQNALRVDPRNGYALSELAALAESRGKLPEAETWYRKLSEQKEFRRAFPDFLLRHQRTKEAITELERASAASPADRAIRTVLVSALLYTGQPDRAETVLNTALRYNSNDTDALLQHAAVELRKGKIKDAEADARQVLHFERSSADAHRLLARVHQMRSETLQQRSELNEALRLDPKLLAVRCELADELIRAGSPRAALDVMNATPQFQRRSILAIVKTNAALLACGEQQAARKGIDQGLALQRSAELLMQDSMWHLTARDYRLARASAEEALVQIPDSTNSLILLVQTYLRQNEGPAALSRLKRHVREHPKSAPLTYFLGQFLETAGNRPEARSAYEAAAGLQPNYLPANLALARLDLAEGRTDEARRTLQRILDSDKSEFEAWFLLGRIEESSKRIPAATEAYRKAVDLKPGSAPALNNLAYLLAEEDKQIDEALRFAQQAVEFAPDVSGFRDTLGWIYYKKGIYASAVTHLEAAVSKESTPRRRYHLAMAYLRLGNIEKGKKSLDFALRADPSLPEALVAQRLWSEQQNTESTHPR